jgi:endonuclease/exonuclease/phosphatase family metal-dependent hydrolase
VLATVLAFVIAPVFSGSDSGYASDVKRDGGAQASLTSGEVEAEDEIPRVGSKPPTRAGKTIELRDQVGLVTMNLFSQLSVAQATADARSLTSRPAVDVVGWQEAQHFAPVFRTLKERGWETKRFPAGAKELAVSWRRSEFEYVTSTSRLVAFGVDEVTGRYPFGNRYIVRVTLRHRATGRLLSVINTHLPHKSEDRDRPGHWTQTSNAARARFQLERMRREWETAPGRWVVGTGDYNFDARADARVALPKAPGKALATVARSSYDVLGGKDLLPTHPPTGRYIDYVHAARSDLESGDLKLLSQRTLFGFNSDHRPLLVRIALR